MRKQTKEIAYQNKDITSKIFAERFKGKSLKVYGIDVPNIKEVLPTNLPDIQANELRVDNLFLLEDDTFLLVDYESSYKKKNQLKYLEYVLRILKQYYEKYGLDMQIRIVIIYTADVSEAQTIDRFDVGSVKMCLQQTFLTNLDSEKIKENLVSNIKHNKKLSDEELMQFIILPLSYPGLEQKKQIIKELFELSKGLEEEVQLFLLSGILVFTDKVIDEKISKQIKEWLKMTKVARLFEEEKEKAVEKAVERAVEETAKGTAIETAKKMLQKGYCVEEIVECVGYLSPIEVEKLKKELNESK